MNERTAFPEPYPGNDAPLLKRVDWWWAYGPMLFVSVIAIGLRILAYLIRSHIQRNDED